MSRRLSSVLISLLVLGACCVAPATAADKIKIGYNVMMAIAQPVTEAGVFLISTNAEMVALRTLYNVTTWTRCWQPLD